MLAIIAVAAGTAMAVSVFVVRTSVARSVADFGAELSGPTELRVVGAVRRGGLGPEVVDRVAAADGVAGAVPVVQAVASLDGLEEHTWVDPGGRTVTYRDGWRRVLVLGVDCSIEALVGDHGCPEDGVTDRGDVPFAVGRGVPDGSRLQTNHGMVTLRNRPVYEGFDGLGDGAFVVYPLPSAQRLFDRGDGVDVVYVQPEDGVDVGELRTRLDELVGEHNAVLDADQGPPEVELALGSALPVFSLLGLFGLGIGGLLVHNTVTLSLEERRRELAVVGALGGTRRVVAWTALGEAGVLGAFGGLLGAAGGLLVAGPIVDTMSNFTEDVAAMPVTLHAGVGAPVLGALLGVVVALGAAVLPARRALRLSVVDELSGRGRFEERPTARHLRRVAGFGTVVLAGVAMVVAATRGGGLATWQPPVGALGFVVMAVGLLLVAAALAPVVLAPVGRLVEGSAAGRLAVANLLRAPGRTAVMVVALTGAVATAFVAAGFSRSIERSLTRSILSNMEGVSVSAAGEGANANLDVALPPEVVDALRAMPEVDEVHEGAVVLAGAGRDEVISVSAFGDPWVLKDRHAVVAGEIDPARFAAGEAVVNTLLARDQDLRPGDELRLPTPSGMVEVPVMAVIHSGGPTGREATLSLDRHRELYGPQPLRAVNLHPVPGVSYDELAVAAVAAVANDPAAARFVQEGPDRIYLHVSTPDQVLAEARGTVRTTMLPFWTLQRGLLGVAFVAILSTLLLVGVQRQREMGMLAAAGMTPPRLAQMVLTEAGLVAVAGAVLGALGGLVTLWAMIEVAPLVIGYANDFHPDGWEAVRAGNGALWVALLAGLWPAYRAATTEVVPALRYE